MPFALALLVLAAAWRLLVLWDVSFVNFSPLLALTFCGAVYFRRRALWLVPLAALALSDLYLNYHYAVHEGYGFDLAGLLTRTACFTAAAGLGFLVARRKSWLTLLGGALGGSVLFYLATNTASWAVDPFYARTAAGWWQALTVGHPGFPPTWVFFRNTFVSDLLFTGLFAGALELAAMRAGRPSLFASATPVIEPANAAR